jgi:hypothetical protein
VRAELATAMVRGALRIGEREILGLNLAALIN